MKLDPSESEKIKLRQKWLALPGWRRDMLQKSTMERALLLTTWLWQLREPKNVEQA